MSQPRVAYAGMTHLGICSAIASASKGFTTVGFAPDAALVARLESGNLPVTEPELDDLLRDNRTRMSFTADAEKLRECNLIYVAPDIPTDDRGGSDLAPLDELLNLVLSKARADATVVVLSQVPPGYTRERMRPGVNLYYQVETLVFGRAVERATKPERFIVGCANPSSPMPAAMQTYLSAFGCPILPMRFESAELAKIAINCCLVSSVSVANTLAELCEGIGADWSEIVPALKLDRRIGQYSYLAPGLGIAGGNLERDLATVCGLADQVGSDAGVVRAWISNSKHRRDWAVRTLRTVLGRKPGAAVSILGLAYKENTHSTKNSPSLALIAQIQDQAIVVHDPVVSVTAVSHPKVHATPTALDCAKGADVLLIMTPWPEYKKLDPKALAATMRGKDLIDPYAVLNHAACRAAGLNVHTLGAPVEKANKS
jgi:UDPglucose 6-dehydrogenase